MSTLKYIIEGYKNLLIKNPSVEEVYKAKKAICNICPHGKNGITCIRVVNVTSDVTGQTVPSHGGCSCPQSALLRSSKPCPKGNF